MRTVVDTSALLALLYPDDAHNDRASELLAAAVEEGPLLVPPVVEAELAADDTFGSRGELDAFLDDTGLRPTTPGPEARFRAGEAFAAYVNRRGDRLQCPSCGHETTFPCPDCGATVSARQHIASDFLIGAQAECEADRLLTFDGGFFGTYFEVEMLSVV